MAHYTVAQMLPSALGFVSSLIMLYIFFKHTHTLLNVMDMIINIILTYTKQQIKQCLHCTRISDLQLFVCKSRLEHFSREFMARTGLGYIMY